MRTKPADGVILVAVLAWISGILQLVAGVIMLIAGSAPATGWAHIAIGLATFPVSLWLFRARTLARVIITIVFLLELAVGVYAVMELKLLATPAVTSAVLALLGLVLLYTPSANASFRAAAAERRTLESAR
jgi:hypothetical protein